MQNPPETEAGSLWRYLDIPRFLDLIQRRALWFSTLDKLQDPCEGLLSGSAVAQYRFVGDFLIAAGTALEAGPSRGMEAITSTLATIAEDRRTLCMEAFDLVIGSRGLFNIAEDGTILRREGERFSGYDLEYVGGTKGSELVNCWQANEVESAAMWELYGNAIAIKSSFDRLYNYLRVPFEESAPPYLLWAAPVKYEEGELRIVGSCRRSTLPPCFFKRKNFEHEREYRIWTSLHELDKPRAGLHINVDLNQLIEHVYVHPKSEDWITQVVQ